MRIFRETGEELEKRWRSAEYDEKVFPDLAAEVLKDSKIFESANAWELVEWGLDQTELPAQKDFPGRFGDPPVTLFNAPRFHIDVYFWLEGTTAIHQHAFCGAFQVFHGSSIHSQYDFKTERRLNFFAQTGELTLRDCELLEVGDVQSILPGEHYIHSLFHLDQPSATIVARTSLSQLDLPQFSYFKPGFAADPFFETPVSVRKLQLLSAAFRSGHPEADNYLEAYLRNSDFHSSFLALQHLRPLLRQKTLGEVFGVGDSGDRFERFVKIVEEVHPQLDDLPSRVFEGSLRTEHIVQLRSVVSEPEHRFFLALLLNVEGSNNVLSLIKARFEDDDPLEKLLDWVSELANTRIIEGGIPNGLGIEGFSDFDTAVLEEMLKGSKGADIENALTGGAEVDTGMRDKVISSIQKIENSIIFSRLVR